MANVFSVDEKEIRTDGHQPVHIEMEGAGASGYSWHVVADASRVRILEHQFTPDETAFGAGGRETFVLQPLVPGRTEVTFRLEAPWEDEPAEIRVVHLTSTVESR